MSYLVAGIGLNDSNYLVSTGKNGKQKRCYFYSVWKSMLERCYDKKYQARFASYDGCTVCKEWLTFSNFKRWMESQDWKGKQLDKDILFKGNKVYSPSKCVFVDGALNSFITEKKSNNIGLPIGVSFHKGNNSFIARRSNPILGRRDNLGYFNCSKKAHKAWLNRKHELACHLADMQTDQKVADALRVRYLPTTPAITGE